MWSLGFRVHDLGCLGFGFAAFRFWGLGSLGLRV